MREKARNKENGEGLTVGEMIEGGRERGRGREGGKEGGNERERERISFLYN